MGLLLGAFLTASGYAASIRIGARVGPRPPKAAVSLDVGGGRYHYKNGVYYKNTPHGYVVTRAPRGAVIQSLPSGHTRVVINGLVYYRHNNVYYRKRPSGYVVVTTPKVVVESNPVVVEPVPVVSSEISVWRTGQEYILMNGQFFKNSPEGLVWQEPPYDAISKIDISTIGTPIWHKDIEYFDVDGILFRKSIHGYKVVEAPWGE